MKRIQIKYEVNTKAIRKAEKAVCCLERALARLKKQGVEITIKRKKK